MRRRSSFRKLFIAAVVASTTANCFSNRAAADTTATWVGTSGDWNDPIQWSTNPNYPNNGTPLGTDYQALIDTDGGGPYSITLDSSVTLDGLIINNANATLQQTAGTLTTSSGIEINAGTYILSEGTIANSTFNLSNSGQLQVDDGTLDDVTVLNGDLLASNLTVQNGISIAGHSLDIYSTLTFDGPGQTVDNLNINANYVGIYPSGPTSVGPQTLTLGPNVLLTGASSFYDGHTGDGLINNGTIDIDLSSSVNPTVKPGFAGAGTIFLIENFTNNNVAEVSNSGLLDISAANWTNSTSANVTDNGSFLVLGGESWTNSGTISGINQGMMRIGEDFAADGELYNTYWTNASTGTIIANNSSLEVIDNGLVATGINYGKISILNGGMMKFDSFNQAGTNQDFINDGIIEINNSNLIVQAPYWSNGLKGTISGDAATMEFDGNWYNEGTINATNDSTVYLGGQFNTAAIGTFNVDSTSQIDLVGTLDNMGAILTPQGAASFAVAYEGAASANNHPGTIIGGTIDVSAGNFLVNGGILNGVSIIGGDLQVKGSAYIQNGLEIADQNLDLSFALLYFDGPSQSINNLNINVNGSANIYASGPDSTGHQTLTLGPGTTINGSITFQNYYSHDSVINNGTVDADADSSTYISVDNFTNNGEIEATGGTLFILSADFVNNGTIALHNGTLWVFNPGYVSYGDVLIGKGTLTGSGTINGNVTLDSDPSTLAFQLSSDTDYDSLTINGNVTLAGNLMITLANGFLPASSDVFTILDINSQNSLTGSFLNVPDGGTLETADGTGYFTVEYADTQFPNEIVLSDFHLGSLPEPATASTLCMLASGSLLRRRRST